jgi:hypothetical protein
VLTESRLPRTATPSRPPSKHPMMFRLFVELGARQKTRRKIRRAVTHFPKEVPRNASLSHTLAANAVPPLIGRLTLFPSDWPVAWKCSNVLAAVRSNYQHDDRAKQRSNSQSIITSIQNSAIAIVWLIQDIRRIKRISTSCGRSRPSLDNIQPFQLLAGCIHCL